MKITPDISLIDIFDAISETHPFHAPSSKTFGLLEKLSKNIFLESGFDSPEEKKHDAGQFGEIFFPFVKMGSVSSLDIFSSMNELVIFAFYWANRDRYKKIADIGANIGLHTILMSRLGWHVKAYEPDPIHLTLLKRNVALNKLECVAIFEAAVSDTSGTLDFVRVVGNTTSSHLAGAKEAPYGKLEKLPVQVVDIRTIIPEVDFIKIDAEGHEKALIEITAAKDFDNMDMMVEVGTRKNADAIFEHLSKIGVNAFTQKTGWNIAEARSEMPDNYRQGSLFISKKNTMPWGA